MSQPVMRPISRPLLYLVICAGLVTLVLACDGPWIANEKPTTRQELPGLASVQPFEATVVTDLTFGDMTVHSTAVITYSDQDSYAVTVESGPDDQHEIRVVDGSVWKRSGGSWEPAGPDDSINGILGRVPLMQFYREGDLEAVAPGPLIAGESTQTYRGRFEGQGNAASALSGSPRVPHSRAMKILATA